MSDNRPVSPNSARRLDDLVWRRDILGEGFENAEILTVGSEPATLVRAHFDSPSSKPALLWIHGMSDYFFQAHVAEHFLAQGYPFYAVDMRRCGRSWREGQRWHATTDLEEYFPELTLAARLIAGEHGSVVPIAHSTGGLIAPLWLDYVRRRDPGLHSAVAGMILNSPWLDMQFPKLLVLALKYPVAVLGKAFPTLAVNKGGTATYGKSISIEEHGSWRFDTTMKPIEGHSVSLGWLRAIFLGQERIHSGDVDTGVPMLTLSSSHSYLRQPYSPAADTADTVLDVADMKRWAPTLARDSQVLAIDGALHDVFLSEKYAREAALASALRWLSDLKIQH
ncbi:alpha/beta hydrolase [Corynebacterium mayonis]|uniref:alpha/beta hydrolase n=1 Tax=Corynebacterium mayonis TaxID=3062461 RepID=UPI00313FF4E7